MSGFRIKKLLKEFQKASDMIDMFEYETYKTKNDREELEMEMWYYELEKMSLLNIC